MAKKKQEIDPVMMKLSEIFIDVLGRQFTATAFCVDLAKSAMGWELAGNQKEARKVIKKAVSHI